MSWELLKQNNNKTKKSKYRKKNKIGIDIFNILWIINNILLIVIKIYFPKKKAHKTINWCDCNLIIYILMWRCENGKLNKFFPFAFCLFLLHWSFGRFFLYIFVLFFRLLSDASVPINRSDGKGARGTNWILFLCV